MLTQNQIERMAPKQMVLKIIASVMIVGGILATGLFCFITQWDKLDSELSMLVLMALVFGTMMLGLSFLASSILSGSGVKELSNRYSGSDSDLHEDSSLIDSLFAIFQTNMLIRLSLIEGALLLNLMVFMLEKNVANLIVVGLGLLIMVVTFPFSGRVISWINNQIRGINS